MLETKLYSAILHRQQEVHAHRAERRYKMKSLVKKLVSEFYELEINYSLDLENDIKEACNSLRLGPPRTY